MQPRDSTRTAANRRTVERILAADPVLVDVRRAGDVVPGMTAATILASGAPLPWSGYRGGQRRAIAAGAVFEGLARDLDEAESKLDAGTIRVEPCHHHGCVGSVAGIYTASMPVLVVENAPGGNRAFCNFYEGESRKRLNYGSYDAEVRAALEKVRDLTAPVIGEAVRRLGGVPLKPIMKRALHMGDELHSRNAAATMLFARALTPALIDMAADGGGRVKTVLGELARSDYFFLRVGMAAAKAIADAAHGVEGSSIVSAMAYSSAEFALRVSGLGERWFRGPLPEVDARYFDGFSAADLEWIGGESIILETVGFGGLAQAAAFPLQTYQGGSADAMAAMNRAMYAIAAAEHDEYRIPYLDFRGVPTGIDVFRVADTGTVPLCDVGLAGREGGQIGAGVLRPPLAPFVAARDAWLATYDR